MEDRFVDLVEEAITTGNDMVPVDSGTLLIVDPCHLPEDVLEKLITPNKYGVTSASVIQAPGGDGLFFVDPVEQGDDSEFDIVYLVKM